MKYSFVVGTVFINFIFGLSQLFLANRVRYWMASTANAENIYRDLSFLVLTLVLNQKF